MALIFVYISAFLPNWKHPNLGIEYLRYFTALPCPFPGCFKPVFYKIANTGKLCITYKFVHKVVGHAPHRRSKARVNTSVTFATLCTDTPILSQMNNILPWLSIWLIQKPIPSSANPQEIDDVICFGVALRGV